MMLTRMPRALRLARDVAHEPAERRLRGVVRHQPRARTQAGDRRDQHDRGAALELGQAGAAAQHRAAQVHGERLIPGFRRRAVEIEPADTDAHVQHQAVDGRRAPHAPRRACARRRPARRCRLRSQTRGRPPARSARPSPPRSRARGRRRPRARPRARRAATWRGRCRPDRVAASKTRWPPPTTSTRRPVRRPRPGARPWDSALGGRTGLRAIASLLMAARAAPTLRRSCG